MARRRFGRRGGRSGKGSFRVTLEIHPPLSEVARGYKDLKRAFSDYRPVWKKLLPRVSAEHQRGFRSKGKAFNSAWPPYSDSYRKRTGKTVVDLRKTGTLASRIGKKISLTKKSLRVGVKGLTYARAQQYGKPNRLFVGVSPRLLRGAKAALNDYAKTQYVALSKELERRRKRSLRAM